MSLPLLNKENIYQLDDLIVDCKNFRLQKNGQNVALTPRAFDVLTFLIKNAGRVVEKQEIFDAVWKDTFVGDNALTKVVKEIRHVLEDAAGAPRYIETVPKRGYRFIGELKEFYEQIAPEVEKKVEKISTNEIVIEEDELNERILQSPPETTSPRFVFSKPALVLSVASLISISVLITWSLFRKDSTETPTSAIRSIAVLPFKPLNADSRDESLEMGMAETLITRLSNLRQVTVRPMSAVRKYTDLQQDPVIAGQEIQVETVLDGSIQKSGERIRVTVRLINVRDNSPLWSEQFDENFTDIFRVQDSIAERVTNALTLQLSWQEKEQLTKHLTNNPESYQLYLRGQLIWHRRRQNWIQQSLEYYQQALEKDPNFALAHIGVADSYMMLSGHRIIPMREGGARAKPSIMKALEIDNNLAQAHNALAEFKYQYEYDWNGAEREFKRAVELNPNVAWIHQAYGWFLMSSARFDEAKMEMERAQELDPSSLTINVGRGRLLYFMRQYDQALKHFQNIIAVEPNDGSSFYALNEIYEQKQMHEKIVEDFLTSISSHGAKPEVVEKFRETFRTSGWQGFIRERLRLVQERAKTRPVDPYNFAHLYIKLGQKDEAFVWLEKTLEAGHPGVIHFKIEPAYDFLRNDPRYVELVCKIGLQP